MSRTMKALLAHAPGDYRLQDVEVPTPSPGEMLVRVAASGICAGDIKAFHGGIRLWGTSEADRYIDAPVTGGHEFAGEVVELGEGVDAFAVGDRVVTEQILPCGGCHFCRTGSYWMCTRSAVFGFKHVCAGGFAEYVLIPATGLCHTIPDSMTWEQAALVEPVACGMHALERARLTSADVVVVAGLGGIGLAMLSIAAARLPRLLIGVDVREDRLARAAEFGADVALPAGPDVAERVRDLTGGLGCDVYIEASGAQASVGTGLAALRNQGRFVQLGVFADLVTADWNVIGDGKEITILGSHLSGPHLPCGDQGHRERTDPHRGSGHPHVRPRPLGGGLPDRGARPRRTEGDVHPRGVTPTPAPPGSYDSA